MPRRAEAVVRIWASIFFRSLAKARRLNGHPSEAAILS